MEKNKKGNIIFTIEFRSQISGLCNGNKVEVGMKPRSSEIYSARERRNNIISQTTSSAAI